MKQSLTLVTSPTLHITFFRRFFLLIRICFLLSLLFLQISLSAQSEIDNDQDGVIASEDIDDSDPCLPYPLFCSMNCDANETESLTFAISGGNTAGFEALLLLTDAEGIILATDSMMNFGKQKTGLYRIYGAYYLAGKKPSGIGIGKAISGLTFPGSCSGLTDSMLYKVCPDPSSFPVEWLDFTAEQIRDEALLKWQTASEEGTSHYEVERSIDGLAFMDIGMVEAAGNSQAIQQYLFRDKKIQNLGQDKLYYRLKQVDLDGQYSYSKLITLSISAADGSHLEAYPNPVGKEVFVRYKTDSPNHSSLMIVNSLGQVVYQQDHLQETATLHLSTEVWPSGIYFISLETENGLKTWKIVK